MHMIRTRYVVVALALITFLHLHHLMSFVLRIEAVQITGIVTDPRRRARGFLGFSVIVTEVIKRIQKVRFGDQLTGGLLRACPCRACTTSEASFAGFKTVTAAGLRVFTAEVFRYDITDGNRRRLRSFPLRGRTADSGRGLAPKQSTVQISTDVPAEIFQYLPVVTRHYVGDD